MIHGDLILAGNTKEVLRGRSVIEACSKTNAVNNNCIVVIRYCASRFHSNPKERIFLFAAISKLIK